jgi:hypothetical protein
VSWSISVSLMGLSAPWLGIEMALGMLHGPRGNAFDLPFGLFGLGLAAASWLNENSPLRGQRQRQMTHWRRGLFGAYFAFLGIAMSLTGLTTLALIALRGPLQPTFRPFIVHFRLPILHHPLTFKFRPSLRFVHRVVELNGTEAVSVLATGVAALGLYDQSRLGAAGSEHGLTSSETVPRTPVHGTSTGRVTPPGTRPRPTSSKRRRRP